jgi:hypothetical protein
MESFKDHNSEDTGVPEEGRRRTGGTPWAPAKPDPEVAPRPKRRYLTVAYKLKVLDTIEALREQGTGEIGSYLRQEGLYYSSISSWQKLRDQGLLTPSGNGGQKKDSDALVKENKQLRRKLARLEEKLAKTEMIVDLQKKLSAILDMEPPNTGGRNDAE